MKLTSYVLLIIYFITSQCYALTPYSNDQLDELEKEFVQLINQSDQVERNPLANQYINHIGRTLALNAHLPQPHFFIVKSPEINAFAGPGGHIGVNTQLILSSSNESELAAVMAHEMAHVRLHHLYQLIEHQKQMRIPMLASILASLALGIINPTLGGGAMMAAFGGLAQDNINFIRSNEKEADRIGIDMLIRAGYNPQGMPSFFRKLQQSSRYYYTDNVPSILRTHPLDDDRIAEAENRIQRQAKKSYQENPEYHLFKELIRTEVTTNPKDLLDYYPGQCQKSNTAEACQYGLSLALIKLDRWSQAERHLNPLVSSHPENPYYQIAMGEIETGQKNYKSATARLNDLYANYPDSYSALMAYAQALDSANQADRAAAILLKGSRLYPKDVQLCRNLARAQARTGMKGYAYFSQAQCLLLEGRHRDAMRQLGTAKKMAGKDEYLQARIAAKMDEIKFILAK